MMKILIAEDDSTSRLILENMLKKWGYDVVSTNDGNDAWKKLQEEDAPRLLILDWMMPGIEGIEICRRLRENSKSEDHYTYVTLLTAKESKENIVTGMEAGADDYITKPFDMHELRVRVRAGERIVQLQSELLEAKKKLEVQSRTDPLTGVLNRRAILSQIGCELSRAKRENTQISVSMLDLDHFKTINDTFGHLAGDAVLRECMHRVQSAIRPYDSVGRFGGEEFIVVLPGAAGTDAFTVAERIRLRINETAANVDGISIPFTISQGVATSNGETNMDGMIAMADQALYRAKKNGRNRVEKAPAQK
jgi:two-component system cell cycle response regulator